jgi:hypothetical protein
MFLPLWIKYVSVTAAELLWYAQGFLKSYTSVNRGL